MTLDEIIKRDKASGRGSGRGGRGGFRGGRRPNAPGGHSSFARSGGRGGIFKNKTPFQRSRGGGHSLRDREFPHN